MTIQPRKIGSKWKGKKMIIRDEILIFECDQYY